MATMAELDAQYAALTAATSELIEHEAYLRTLFNRETQHLLETLLRSLKSQVFNAHELIGEMRRDESNERLKKNEIFFEYGLTYVNQRKILSRSLNCTLEYVNALGKLKTRGVVEEALSELDNKTQALKDNADALSQTFHAKKPKWAKFIAVGFAITAIALFIRAAFHYQRKSENLSKYFVEAMSYAGSAMHLSGLFDTNKQEIAKKFSKKTKVLAKNNHSLFGKKKFKKSSEEVIQEPSPKLK